jgi:Bacterial PH domain
VNAAGPTQIDGINEPLPSGEHVLWQGAPDWRSLARTALHIRTFALYFALMLGWRLTSSLADGRAFGDALLNCAALALLALVALGLIAGFAWLAARTTIYAITTERVVMRVGVAMPIFVNIPFSGIEAVALKAYRDGSGDIPLALKEDVRLAYLHLWPHVRPWQMAHPQPMLRALPEASTVAELLAERLALTTPVAAPRSAATARATPTRNGVLATPEDTRVAA